MRSFFLVLLLVGSAHGLFGTIGNIINNVGNTISGVTNTIGQTAVNLWNGATGQVTNMIGNVVDSAGNIYGQLVQTANGVQFVSNFLWDNVFGPATGMLIEGGQLFLDDKFGNIASVIGRRSVVPENILSAKYVELATRFTSNIHQLFNKLFEMEKEGLLALQKGEQELENQIRLFYTRVTEVDQQITQWISESKSELEKYAQTLQGDWVHALQHYSQVLDNTGKTLRAMFQRLTEDLLKNLLQVANKIVPGALAIVEKMKEQGFLSFLSR